MLPRKDALTPEFCSDTGILLSDTGILLTPEFWKEDFADVRANALNPLRTAPDSSGTPYLFFRSYVWCPRNYPRSRRFYKSQFRSYVWCPRNYSRILQSLTVAHTWRHHRRQGTSGHVWQGRFRSPVIQDGDHLLVVLRYIEANPVRAAMVADPCEYTWSSHRYHGAGHADPILDSFPEWEQLGRTEPERRARWRRKVRGEQPVKELDAVRSSLRSGRPYGAED